MYKDRGVSFVAHANTLKEIYVSSCKCVRQAHTRHAATLPAGRHVDLGFCRGFDGKLGRRLQNHSVAANYPPRRRAPRRLRPKSARRIYPSAERGAADSEMAGHETGATK
jgi:hypothetical protein